MLCCSLVRDKNSIFVLSLASNLSCRETILQIKQSTIPQKIQTLYN